MPARMHHDARGRRVLQHVGEGFEQDALQLQGRPRGEGLQRRNDLHVPHQFDAGCVEPRLQAVAQGGQHGRQVVVRGLQRIDGHAHFVERELHVLLDHGAVRLGLRHHVEQAHQLRAHAVVDLPHDALALQQHGLFLILLAHGFEGAAQLIFALRHAGREVGVERAVVGHGAAVALDHEAGQDHHEEEHRVRRQREVGAAEEAHAHQQQIVRAGQDGQRARRHQHARDAPPIHQRAVHHVGQADDAGQLQDDQAGGPQRRPRKGERGAGQRDRQRECGVDRAHQPRRIALEHQQHEARDQPDVAGIADRHHGAPQRPGNRHVGPHAVEVARHARERGQREAAVERIALAQPQAAGNAAHQQQADGIHDGRGVAPALPVAIERRERGLGAVLDAGQPRAALALDGRAHDQRLRLARTVQHGRTGTSRLLLVASCFGTPSVPKLATSASLNEIATWLPAPDISRAAGSSPGTAAAGRSMR